MLHVRNGKTDFLRLVRIYTILRFEEHPNFLYSTSSLSISSDSIASHKKAINYFRFSLSRMQEPRSDVIRTIIGAEIRCLAGGRDTKKILNLNLF